MSQISQVRSVRSIEEILSGKTIGLNSESKTGIKNLSEVGKSCDANNRILDWINIENQSDTVPKAGGLHIVSSFLDEGEVVTDDDNIVASLSNCKLQNDIDDEERVTVVLRLRNCDHYEVELKKAYAISILRILSRVILENWRSL